MLQNDRDNLELDKLQIEIRKFTAETRKFMEEMSRPAPTAARAFLLPFSIGAAFALTTFVVVALVARLV